jgi:hypothetical protein
MLGTSRSPAHDGSAGEIRLTHVRIVDQLAPTSLERGRTGFQQIGMGEVPSLDIAEVAEPKQKLAAQVGHYRIRWPTYLDVTEVDEFRLLRARRERLRSSRVPLPAHPFC